MNQTLLLSFVLTALGFSHCFAEIIGFRLSGVTTSNNVAAGDITTEFPVGTPWTATLEWDTSSTPQIYDSYSAGYAPVHMSLTFTGVTETWTNSTKPDQGSFYVADLSNFGDQIVFGSNPSPSNHTNPVIENWEMQAISIILNDPSGTAFSSVTPAPTRLDFSKFSPLVANSYLFLKLNNTGSDNITGRIESISPISVIAPEISIKQGTSELTDGSATTNFGTVKLGKPGKVKSYLITNSGDAPLDMLAISFSGKNKADFKVGKLPKTSLAANESMTVTVTFKPKGKAKGNRNAVLKVTSNDADENPFDIKLRGSGK